MRTKAQRANRISQHTYETSWSGHRLSVEYDTDYDYQGRSFVDVSSVWLLRNGRRRDVTDVLPEVLVERLEMEAGEEGPIWD